MLYVYTYLYDILKNEFLLELLIALNLNQTNLDE